MTVRKINHGTAAPSPGSGGKPLRIRIAVDAESGLVHSVTTTPTNAHYVTHAAVLPQGKEQEVFADSGYRGVHKPKEVQAQHPHVNWHIALMPGQRKAMNKSRASNALKEQLEKIKATIHANVEHPFRDIKCNFGHREVCYRGLAKNTSELLVMFARSELWMVRKRTVQGLQK